MKRGERNFGKGRWVHFLAQCLSSFSPYFSVPHFTVGKLRYLRLTETKVTEEGVQKLQQALPKCKIEL